MKRIMLIAAVWLGASCAASAQSADQYNQLKQQVDNLKQEVDGLKTAGSAPASQEAAEKKLEWGGFGEMAYQDFGERQENGSPANLHDVANLTRLSVDGIYRFDDQIRAKFEVELLNAGANALTTNSLSKNISVDVEQAWVEDKLTAPLGVRAGLILVPMGLVNEHHRPTDYVGVFRPSVETYLIPSCWREMGAGVFGAFGPDDMVSYRSYVVPGLDPVGNNGINQVSGFSGSQAIKGGRSLGALSLAQNGAWVSRVDVSPAKDVFAGGSYYFGRAGQGLVNFDVPISIWELHAHAESHNARLQALFVQGNIANAGAIDAAQKANLATFTDYVGDRFWGGYVTLDYNVLPLIKPEGMKSLEYVGPYFRYERYDTSAHMPVGYAGTAANSRTEYTVGVSLRPVKHVIVKTEYQWLNNRAHSEITQSPGLVSVGQYPLTGIHEWNLGLGYEF